MLVARVVESCIAWLHAVSSAAARARALVSSYCCGSVRPWVTHLLFLSLVVDDPVVDRKLSLSPFTFSYYQAFLQAFLQLENRSQQVSRLDSF